MMEGTSLVRPWVLDGFLTPYQEQVLDDSRRNMSLWWACGSGKSLAGLLWLARGSSAEKAVIITRAPTKAQWAREAQRYTTLRPQVLNGLTAYEPTSNVVVLSWATVQGWADYILRWARGGELAVIWDEIHKGKSWKRKERLVARDGSIHYAWLDNRAASCAKLARGATRRLGLTATPVRDRRSDLWAQLDLVEPGAWDSNWEFIHRYCDARPGQYQGANALFEMKLLEAASRKRIWIADTVRDAVENGQKVVVLTGRRRDCEALARLVATRLKKNDTPMWWGHGGISMKERDAMVRAYAATEDPCAFVGTTDAFGEAIDGLQNTDLVVFGLLPWTPGQVTQAEGRFSRHGSKRSVHIMYTVAEGTVDEHVADLLLEKLEQVVETLDDANAEGIANTLAAGEDDEQVLAGLIALME